MEAVNIVDVTEMFQTIFGVTQERIQSALPAIAALAAAEIAERAPSHEQEYEMIMRGMGADVDLIPLSGDSSADPDGRQRFNRAPGMWLREQIVSPVNVRVNLGNLTISLGNMESLIANSVFSYTNHGRSGSTTYTSNFDGNLFPLLEFGGAYTVQAVHAQRLAPDANKSHRRSSMTKSFQGFRMYSSFDPAVLYEALVELARL